jgi:hypothetical protein
MRVLQWYASMNVGKGDSQEDEGTPQSVREGNNIGAEPPSGNVGGRFESVASPAHLVEF